MNFIQKNWKALLFSIALFGLLIVGVMAFHWEETAKKPFWFKIWPYLGVVSICLFIWGVTWLGKQKNKKW